MTEESSHSPVTLSMLTEVMERTINGVVIADRQGKINWVNAGFERITGYRASEVIGKSPGKLLQGPKTDLHVDERMRQAVQKGEPFDEIILNYTKAGQEFWNHIKCQPLMQHGHHCGFMAIETDITETIQFQNQLIEANQRTQELAEQLMLACVGGQVGSWEWNPDTNALYFHESWIRLFDRSGMEPASHLNTWLERVHPQDCQKVIRQLSQVSQSETDIFVSEHRLRMHAEEYRWTLARGQVLTRDQSGHPTRVLGVHVDITEQKLVQQMLDQQNDMLRTILDVIPFSVCWKDQQLRFLGCNRQFADASGFESPQQIVGKTAGELGWNCEVANAEQVLEQQVIQSGIPVLHKIEQRMIDESRKSIVDLSKAPLYLQDGSTGVLSIYIDITELEQIRENLTRKEQELRHKGRMQAVGELAGGVAHEFNNLLQAIRGYVSFARDDVPHDSTTYEDLCESLKTIDRAVELTRQLLRFSRVDEMDRVPSDPNALIHDLQVLLRPLISSQIEVRYELAKALPPLACNAVAMVQVLLNLCVNARDAMPTGGVLTVGTRLDRNDHQWSVVFFVEDTGIGIPEEIIDRIFDPFFTTKEVGKGTGLGLSMVYSTIEEHNGRIKVESQPGKGTQFEISIPVENVTRSQANFYHLQSSQARQKDESEGLILIAEDDQAVRLIAERMLHKLNFRVIAATNGLEAIEKYQENHEELVGLIFDVKMPQMTGPQAYRKIRELGGDLPTIFCTGYELDLTSELETMSDRMRVLTKPYDLFVLRDTLHDLGISRLRLN